MFSNNPCIYIFLFFSDSFLFPHNSPKLEREVFEENLALDCGSLEGKSLECKSLEFEFLECESHEGESLEYVRVSLCINPCQARVYHASSTCDF